MIKILVYYVELISHVEKMKLLSLCILNFIAFLTACAERCVQNSDQHLSLLSQQCFAFPCLRTYADPRTGNSQHFAIRCYVGLHKCTYLVFLNICNCIILQRIHLFLCSTTQNIGERLYISGAKNFLAPRRPLTIRLMSPSPLLLIPRGHWLSCRTSQAWLHTGLCQIR